MVVVIDAVCQQGTIGTTFYIVLSGTAGVYVNNEPDSSRPIKRLSSIQGDALVGSLVAKIVPGTIPVIVVVVVVDFVNSWRPLFPNDRLLQSGIAPFSSLSPGAQVIVSEKMPYQATESETQQSGPLRHWSCLC